MAEFYFPTFKLISHHFQSIQLFHFHRRKELELSRSGFLNLDLDLTLP